MPQNSPCTIGARPESGEIHVTLPPGVSLLVMTPAQTKDFIACLQRNLKKLPRKRTVKAAAPTDVWEVFDYWRTVMNRPKARLTPERERKIRARLKLTARLNEGLVSEYSVADIKRAIDGCKASPHHQGQNQNSTKYDDIELICRTGSKLEQFIELAPKAKAAPLIQHPPECECLGSGLIVVPGKGARRCTSPNLPKGE